MVLSRITQLDRCKDLAREPSNKLSRWSITLGITMKFTSGNAEGSSVILGVQVLFRSMRGSASCVGDTVPCFL